MMANRATSYRRITSGPQRGPIAVRLRTNKRRTSPAKPAEFLADFRRFFNSSRATANRKMVPEEHSKRALNPVENRHFLAHLASQYPGRHPETFCLGGSSPKMLKLLVRDSIRNAVTCDIMQVSQTVRKFDSTRLRWTASALPVDSRNS